MNSPRTIPCVLVFPPRSKPPGFQSPRICVVKLDMIELRYSSSFGSSFSSAIFNPSSLRCMLMSTVVKRAIGSRSTLSNTGRSHGSNRRSICKRNMMVSLAQSNNREPVLARGIWRLVFEFTIGRVLGEDTEGVRGIHGRRARLSFCRKLQREMNELLLTPVNNPQIDARCDFAYFVSNPVRDERSLRVVEHDALLLIEPAFTLVNLGDNHPMSVGSDHVDELALDGIKHFAFPREEIHDPGDLIRDLGAGRHNCRPFALPAGNVAGRAIAENFVE